MTGERARRRQEILIRVATPADASVVTGFARLLAESQEHPVDIIDETAVRRDMLSNDSDMTVLLAERDGEATGYAALLPAYETSYAAGGLYVSDLFVAPDHRRDGIGRLLMAAAARLAAMRGGSHLWLTMMQANRDADRFYSRIADIREDRIVAFAVTGEAFDSPRKRSRCRHTRTFPERRRHAGGGDAATHRAVHRRGQCRGPRRAPCLRR